MRQAFKDFYADNKAFYEKHRASDLSIVRILEDNDHKAIRCSTMIESYEKPQYTKYNNTDESKKNSAEEEVLSVLNRGTLVFLPVLFTKQTSYCQEVLGSKEVYFSICWRTFRTIPRTSKQMMLYYKKTIHGLAV